MSLSLQDTYELDLNFNGNSLDKIKVKRNLYKHEVARIQKFRCWCKYRCDSGLLSCVLIHIYSLNPLEFNGNSMAVCVLLSQEGGRRQAFAF